MDEDDVEREGSENEGAEGEDGDGQAKQEYVKKEFVARPYVNPVTEGEVRALTIKNSRYASLPSTVIGRLCGCEYRARGGTSPWKATA